jgi:type 1 glutamine amidotransferase
MKPILSHAYEFLSSRRRFLETAASLGLFDAGSRLGAQAPSVPEAAAAPIRASREAAKLVQVQVMIGNGVDYEFLRMFEDFGDLNIRVSSSPAAYRNLMPDPAAQSGRGAVPGGVGSRRRETDVIVLYDQIYDMPVESQQNVMRYVEAGKGIVVLHNALTDYQRWPFWYRDVVGGAYLIRDTGMPKVFEGLHERGPADEALPDNPSSSPDKMIAPGVWNFQEYTIKPVGNHPVLTGVQSFTVRDEKYKNTWRSDKITPVLETDDPASDRVIGWIGPHPKARVFALILGHSADAHAHPMYRRIVHNAILWAGGRLG